MGDLMHQRLDRLRLAHAGAHHDAVFRKACIALRFAGKVLLFHGERGKGGKAFILSKKALLTERLFV